MPLTATRLLVAVAFAAVSAACSVAAQDPASGEAVADDSNTEASAITGTFPVGSTLRATANLNLRSGPSTSNSVLDIIDKGDTATVARAEPSNGFYQISYGGTKGWSSGKYLALVSPNGGASGGGSSGGPTSGGSGGERWSCGGSWGTTKVSGGSYYATSFGCWVDGAGKSHGDSGDNCIPGCLSKARSAGLCAGMSGPDCERAVNWYAADAGRFGCLARIKVTNPKNGRSAVLAVLDYGPACWVEQRVSHGVLDMSGRASQYLFGGGQGYQDRSDVVVTEVPATTPLGP